MIWCCRCNIYCYGQQPCACDTQSVAVLGQVDLSDICYCCSNQMQASRVKVIPLVIPEESSLDTEWHRTDHFHLLNMSVYFNVFRAVIKWCYHDTFVQPWHSVSSLCLLQTLTTLCHFKSACDCKVAIWDLKKNFIAKIEQMTNRAARKSIIAGLACQKSVVFIC